MKFNSLKSHANKLVFWLFVFFFCISVIYIGIYKAKFSSEIEMTYSTPLWSFVQGVVAYPLVFMSLAGLISQGILAWINRPVSLVLKRVLLTVSSIFLLTFVFLIVSYLTNFVHNLQGLMIGLASPFWFSLIGVLIAVGSYKK